MLSLLLFCLKAVDEFMITVCYTYLIKRNKCCGGEKMNDQENKEMLYFQCKLSNVTYNPQRFKIMLGEDKFLFGTVSVCSSSKNVSKRSPKRLAPWST